jgi:hypothetical protein
MKELVIDNPGTMTVTGDLRVLGNLTVFQDWLQEVIYDNPKLFSVEPVSHRLNHVTTKRYRKIEPFWYRTYGEFSLGFFLDWPSWKYKYPLTNFDVGIHLGIFDCGFWIYKKRSVTNNDYSSHDD